MPILDDRHLARVSLALECNQTCQALLSCLGPKIGCGGENRNQLTKKRQPWCWTFIRCTEHADDAEAFRDLGCKD